MSLKAKHITSQENYRKIRETGVLRPMQRLRQLGEDGYGLAIDTAASDSSMVFFSVTDFYVSLKEKKSDIYGFVFDAELLIHEFGGQVGPDLMMEYEDLANEIAKQIDASLPPKPPLSGVELQDFAEQMHITELNHIREYSTSHHRDLIDAIHHQDASVPGGEAAIRLFSERAKRLRLEKRKSGTEAYQMLEKLLQTGEGIEDNLEIVIAHELPISLATYFIEAGILFYPGR